MNDSAWIVDTDIHPYIDPQRVADFLPQPWRRRVQSGNAGPGHLGYWNPNGVRRSDVFAPDDSPEKGKRVDADAATMVKHHLDRFALSHGILNADLINVGLSPETDFACAFMSGVNEAIVTDWFAVSPRILASIHVTPTDPQHAAAEIRRWAAHPQFVQVLMPSGSRTAYGSRLYHPIYAAAEECGLPVAIHPGTEGLGVSGVPTAAGYPSNYLEWHTGLVGSYLAHLISLISEGVFVKFPKLKFVMIEGGVSWLVPVLWRFDKNWKALRQLSPWLIHPPSHYAYEHILLTTQPIEEPENPQQLQTLLAMMPIEKMLMFSSDYPHWDGDTPDFVGRHIPAAHRQKVLRDTAWALYRLDERTKNIDTNHTAKSIPNPKSQIQNPYVPISNHELE